MTLKSVLDIEVNDDAFKAYKAAFDQYEAAVKRLPGDWAKAGAAIEGSRKSFDELVGKLVAQSYQAKQQALAQKQADALTRSQADSWKQMAHHTKDVVENLITTTKNIVKWVGPIAIITGLLGAAGGLFGMDRLALAVSGNRRSAMGLGVSYGQQNAFALNYGRFVDPNAMLGNVSTGLYNITSDQYRGLTGAGLSSSYLNNPNNSAADVSVEFLKALPGIFPNADKMDKGLIGTIAEGRGLNSILPTEDIVRYLHASPEERAKQEQSYRKDASSLDVSAKDQLAYTNFITQLDRAGQQIETVLARGLVGLAKPLEDLSKSFVKFITMFLESDALKGWINELRKGLDWLAKEIGSPDLADNVAAFVRGVQEFIHQIKSWVDWFASKYHIAADIAGFATGAPVVGSDAPSPTVAPPPGSPGGYNIAPNRDRLAVGYRHHRAGSTFTPHIFPRSPSNSILTRRGPSTNSFGSPPALPALSPNATSPPSRLGNEFLGKPSPYDQGGASVSSTFLQRFMDAPGSGAHNPHNDSLLHRPHTRYQGSGTRPHVELNSPTGGHTIINNLTAAN